MADRLAVQIVSKYKNGPSVPARAFRVLLAEEIRCFRTSTDDHGVWWDSGGWLKAGGWSRQDRTNIQTLATWLASRHVASPDSAWRLISRADVFARATTAHDDMFLLAVLAWGYGATNDRFGNGPMAAKDARNKGVSNIVRSLQAAAVEGPEATFRAWSGIAKVARLGPSYASKLAHFACYNRRSGSGPLIADTNTAWAYWLFTREEGSAAGPVPYSRYVTWCEEQARVMGHRSDDIERAMFGLGQDIRQIYNHL